MRLYIFFILIICSFSTFAQYSMSNQTVTDCIGSLSDSEANTQQAGWYDHNENFVFTICPNGAASIIINFSFFNTEPINDYVIIYDGPNVFAPVLAGPFSGVNTPPQIVSSGCVTIVFVSDLNVAADGFNLSWETIIDVPDPPVLILPNNPVCSVSVIEVLLDQNIHCDSVFTANISVGGQINQTVNAIPLSCLNDSTNLIQLNLSPGLNQSGSYNVFFESYFKDVCDSIWSLSSSLSFDVLDCPLIVDLVSDNDTICLGNCTDLNVNVSGGDAATYNFNWIPVLPNSSGPHQVCPIITSQYIVSVSDLGPASLQSDTVTIVVVPPTTTQSDFSICNTDLAVSISASPSGGIWSGSSIVNGLNPIFDPLLLSPGVYTLTYSINGCSNDLNITVLEVNAGEDISACINSPIFNLNSSSTTPGGIWSGSSSIQNNGDINVGSIASTIEAVYSLPNGCSDTLLVNVVNNINMPNNLVLCQNSNDTILNPNPGGGIWSTLGVNTLLPSSCLNSIDNFPYVESFESSLADWSNDINNDFDWVIYSNATPSNNTGPSAAYDGNNYIYTESSNSNFPFKNSSITSPCINMSQYDNPILNFYYHKFGNGNDNAILSIDISTDNGLSWQLDIWNLIGNIDDQWHNQSLNLSSFISSELRIRFRVLTGNHWSSDIAIDKVSLLGGPINNTGIILPSVGNSGNHIFEYSIEGCSDNISVLLNEINAGNDITICPDNLPFNLIASPFGGTWSGNNITNFNTGLYDPSLSLGLDIVTYSYNSCTDTAEINILNTELFIDSLFFCHNSALQYIDLDIAPRTPYNGLWNGNGIVDNSFPGSFNANFSGPGCHIISFNSNNCTDSLVIKVFSAPIFIDTLVCANSLPFILNINQNDGVWDGPGIIDNNLGLFDPSTLAIGNYILQYTSPNGCIDTFNIEVINPPNLSFLSTNTNYCYIDSFFNITTFPSGGVLSGNGIVNSFFNPSIAGSGYHNITYTYGSGNCIESIDTILFVEAELITTIFQSTDTVCFGELINFSANVSGGTGNYMFNWSNNLSNSFSHLFVPNQSDTYVLNVSDGCSEMTIDSIFIFVFDEINLNFMSSSKKCFGEYGYAKVTSNLLDNISYSWNTNPVIFSDSIYALVNRDYIVEATNNLSNCIIKDTVRILGYDNLLSSFSLNNIECLSILNSEIQLLDQSIVNPDEISLSSYWDFGDNKLAPYTFSLNPVHTYSDTGTYKVNLYLINSGGCIDSSYQEVCVLSESKIFIPNSFTPDNDNCNDFFYVKAIGMFYEFEISIHERWNNSVIFSSNEIVLTNDLLEGSNCDNNIQSSYYKMGAWDGKLLNGSNAPFGAYAYELSYKKLKDSKTIRQFGIISLVR